MLKRCGFARGLMIIMVVYHLLPNEECLGQRSIEFLREGEPNYLRTAVPFLLIPTDSRAGGVADAGTASRPDSYSQYWNNAKYVFMEREGGVAMSYIPWLRKIVPDMSLSGVAGYYKPNERQAISASLRYFSLGRFIFSAIEGEPWGTYYPREIAADLGYSRILGDRFSAGIVFRYIHSSLLGSAFMQGDEYTPGWSVASDLGVYYQSELPEGEPGTGYAWGFTLANLGMPVTYSADSESSPLPSEVRAGGRFDIGFDASSRLSILLELSKLLVPTPPYSENDTIVRGFPEPGSVVGGMVSSFYDAPGIRLPNETYSPVYLEEISEIIIKSGIEYTYLDQFSLRTGYFHEFRVKGTRRFITAGVGMAMNDFSIDLSYLVPVNAQDSPLANTLRFSMEFTFGSKKKKEYNSLL